MNMTQTSQVFKTCEVLLKTNVRIYKTSLIMFLM